MQALTRVRTLAVATTIAVAAAWAAAQAQSLPEEFSAIAIQSDEFGSGANRVLLRVTRWSTEAERERLVHTLRTKGQRALLDELSDARSVGTIRTPDTLAYDLRYAHQTPTADGGRQIVLATDRPIAFWEAASSSRTLEYPFAVIQMQMPAEGKGKGTLSYATKILAYGNIIELENFSIAPIMLRDIESSPDDDE